MESGTLKATVERLRDEAVKRGKELEETGSAYVLLSSLISVETDGGDLGSLICRIR